MLCFVFNVTSFSNMRFEHFFISGFLVRIDHLNRAMLLLIHRIFVIASSFVVWGEINHFIFNVRTMVSFVKSTFVWGMNMLLNLLFSSRWLNHLHFWARVRIKRWNLRKFLRWVVVAHDSGVASLLLFIIRIHPVKMGFLTAHYKLLLPLGILKWMSIRSWNGISSSLWHRAKIGIMLNWVYHIRIIFRRRITIDGSMLLMNHLLGSQKMWMNW